MTATSIHNLYPYIELFYQAVDLSDRQDAGLNNLSRALHSRLGRYGLYYELKQDPRGLEIDLSCEIPGELDTFCAALPGLDIPQSWSEMVQDLLSPKSASCSSKPGVSLMGLEFDTHCPYPLRPSIFFSSPKEENSNTQWLQAIMDQARKAGFCFTGIQECIDDFLNALHSPDRIVHAGFMLPRGNQGAMKCIMSGITAQQLSLLAETLKFSLSEHLYNVWSNMVNEGNHMHLALDFIPDRPVKPAWEIFTASNQNSQEDRWESLLQNLPDYGDKGLGRTRAQTCVQSWIAYDPWPVELKNEMLSNADVVNSLMVTKLDHIKLFDDPEGQLQYKCYYYQCPVFQTKSRKLVR
ncbi:MAG: hypothetical protein R6U22_00650 [Desulfohalobiaceae bacterium]